MKQLGTTMVALLPDEHAAAAAIGELAALGVARDRIGVATRSDRHLRELAERERVHPIRVEHGERGVLGVLGALGRLAKLEDLTPSSSLADVLVAAGVPEDRAAAASEQLQGSRVLIVVPGDAPASAARVLVERGAQLPERGEVGRVGGGEVGVVELREERLEVGRRMVKTGEVVIRTEVVSEVQTFEVPLQREEVVIEHRRLDPSGAPIPDQVEVIRIPLNHEEAVITKRTIVTGEVDVRKEQIVETQRFAETVRREVLHVDGEGTATVHDVTSVPRSPTSGDPTHR